MAARRGAGHEGTAGRGSQRAGRTRARPPHDNPLLRQQDHLYARLSGDEEIEPVHVQRTMTMAAAFDLLKPAAASRGTRQRVDPASSSAARRLAALRAVRSGGGARAGGALAMPFAPGASNWVQLGPMAIPNGQTYGGARVLVTGRITAIAVDQSDPTTIYVGAARGGIWKTSDGGQTWSPLSDNELSLATGALAVAASDPQVVYAGTGEGNLERYVQSFPLSSSPDNYLGNGVLKSTDGGATWTQQGAAQFTGAGFYRIAVHPTDANTAYAATSNGLFRTTNGGGTWTQLTGGLPAISSTVIAATDVAIDPSNPNNVYCAFFAGGVYKTSNSSAASPTWTKQTSVLPSAGIGRIAISISRSAPSMVYAIFSDSAESIQGVYRTTTGGGTWASLGLTVGSITGSSSYTLDLSVDPSTPDIVYISGTSLFKATRNTITGVWSLTEIGANIHPDNHCFAFDPVNHLVIYAGTDGGIYKSIDGGASWLDTVNRGMCITQYEMIDQHPTSDALVIGGTQDNGTEQYRNSPVFYHSDEGDGGFAAVDQSHPQNVLHGYYGSSLARSTQTGDFGTWFDASGGITGNSIFYPPFALDQTNSNNIAYGTDRICLDGSQGLGGWPVSVALPGISGRVSAVCYVNSSLIYAGTTAGSVYKLTKSGTTWSATPIHAAPLPGRWVWDISTRPGSVDTVIVVVSGFGTGHVWRGAVPATGSATWTDISGTAPGRLPDIPANSLAIEPGAPDTIYVGTDIGVFRTTNGGAGWVQFSQGLPNCAVYDLKLQNPSRLLRAATHGRGLWERKVDAASMPDVDIFVRDNLMESGYGASAAGGTAAGFDDPLQFVGLGDTLYWYMCADIKVDALEGSPPSYQMNTAAVDYVAFESKLQHRNARRGNVNRVYVQVHNRGILPASNVTVKVLSANASAGLPPLPADFWTAFPGDSTDTTVWTPVGPAQVVPAISPSVPATLEWDWSTPLSTADHTCLLVVCDCADDPMPAASKVFDVYALVPGERRVGLKNLHVVNALASAPYWTPFQFFGRAEQAHTVRILPSRARGWRAGLVLQSGAQKNLKLEGISASKPTAGMLSALRDRIGTDIKVFDVGQVYLVDDLRKGGALTGLALPKGKTGGHLQGMLLLVPPATAGAAGTISIQQEANGVLLGGSTFAVRSIKAK